jgi:hypothetical protein
VWLLFDNLDKSWPVRAARPEDILLLRSLLEATRKLQRQLDNRGIGVHSIVFIRNDIYQHLLLEPGDRGKDTAVLLKRNDPEAFKEVIGRRISQSTNASGSFDELWPLYFVTHVREQPSFEYILGRTLMRPREVLKFVRECINVAINRRRERVSEDDILYAERAYSDDALVDISLELKDVQPAYVDIPYAFVGSKATLSRQELEVKLSDAGVQPTSAASVIELLLWFGFLGAYVREDDERYSYQYDYNLTRMTADLQLYAYTIHPAFRAALGCTPP